MQALAGLHDAGVDQLLVVFAHGLEQRLVFGLDARFAVLGRFHQNHDAHDLSPC